MLPVESLARGWTTSSTGTYVVAIDDVAALWARLDKNARRLVRRAEEAGVTVTADNDFESLFSLHNEIHRRKGAPLYLPHNSFRELCDGLMKEGLGCIITARSVQGEPLASQLVLTGPFLTSHTVCAGSAEEGLSVGATPYLRWRAFEFLSQRGYIFNDLTDASLPEVARFKKQLGGALKTNTVVRFRDSLPFRAIEALSKFREKVRVRA